MNARKRQSPLKREESRKGSSRSSRVAEKIKTDANPAAEEADGDNADESILEEAEESAEADFFEDVTCFYMSQIGGKRLLTLEEEHEHAVRAKAGDVESRQIMIEHNLRLVTKVAKRYLYHGVPFLDLVEEGNIGLIHALDRFDPERGFRFATYAVWWVRQAIERCIMTQSRTIRLPGNILKKINRIRRVFRTLEPESPLERRIAKAAALLNVPVDEVRRVLYLSENVISLDVPLEGAPNYSFGDLIADSGEDNPETRLQEQETNRMIEHWLACLTSRQREIVERRYGLNGREPSTLMNIAADLGLTCERVRQIQQESLESIRRTLKEGGLEQESLL